MMPHEVDENKHASHHLRKYFMEAILPPQDDEYPEGDFDPEHPPRDPEEDD